MPRAVPLALLLAGLGLPAPSARAQTPPETDVFVAPLTRKGGTLAVGAPVNVTARPGYDNQPWFLPDGRALLYISEREGQTDVFRYELESGKATQVTATPEREYSPTLVDGGKTLMVVRWAADMSEGHLWHYTPDGQPQKVAPGDAPRVGYYAFGAPDTLALFINDDVQSFLLSDLTTGKVEKIGEKLGGSAPRAIPGERAVSFLKQDAAGRWWIHRLDLATRKDAPLVRVLPGATQYAWLRDGRILMGKDNALHVWDRKKGKAWTKIASFTGPALQDVTRIAVSPAEDRIAFVAGPRPAEKP
jgi:hypothetical protein